MMPGLFGLAGSTGEREMTPLMSAMAASMRHHSWYSEFVQIDDDNDIALGQVSRGSGKTACRLIGNHAGTMLAVMEGEIYDYDERRRELEACGLRFQSSDPVELVLKGFEERGDRFLRMLHGKFAIAIWDQQSRKLHLINDRFGMKPIYYAHVNGRLIFGSEIKTLLVDPDVNRRTNLRGVAQFFTFGQLLGEDSLYEGIKLLPAAGLLTYDVDSDRVSLKRYWRLHSQVAVGRSQTESLDRIDAAFTASVQRMTDGVEGLGLSLSGGLDARTILGVFGPGKSLTTVSLGMAGSMDHVSANAMSSLLGYQHKQVILGESFLSEYESHLRHMVRLTDGQYLCQCIVMPTLPIYRDLGVRVLLRGHAGELMHMSKAYNFSVDPAGLQLRDQNGLFGWLWQHLQSFMLDGTNGKLFVDRHRSAIEDLARESLRDCVSQCEGMESIPHRIWQVFLEQRSRRETALSLVEFESLVETRLPFLDNELIDELFAAPPELKVGDTIQTHVLRRHRPALLNVTNVNTGTRVGASRAVKSVAKLRMKVLSKLGVSGYQPYERLGLWLRRELRPLVRRLLLNDRCLSRGLFDPEAMRTVVEDHMCGRKNHTYLLLSLMVFEVGQQEFVDRPVARVPQAVAV